MNHTQANPFQAPASVIAPVEQPFSMEVASNYRRFATNVVDCIVYVLLCAVLGVFIGVFFGRAGLEAFKRIPNFISGSTILFVYYVFFEGIWARTPGKWLFGTVVVTDSGSKPGLANIAVRTLCRFIPFEAFSFFGKKGWHDSISHTLVVRSRRAN